MGPTEPRRRAVSHDRIADFADYIVNRLFLIGLKLESARSITGEGPAGERIGTATDEVDELIGEIRTMVLDLPVESPSVLALRGRMAHSARELQSRALEAAARLERQASAARRPTRLDLALEIKRWLAFAEQADQMARRWERRDPA